MKSLLKAVWLLLQSVEFMSIAGSEFNQSQKDSRVYSLLMAFLQSNLLFSILDRLQIRGILVLRAPRFKMAVWRMDQSPFGPLLCA